MPLRVPLNNLQQPYYQNTNQSLISGQIMTRYSKSTPNLYFYNANKVLLTASICYLLLSVDLDRVAKLKSQKILGNSRQSQQILECTKKSQKSQNSQEILEIPRKCKKILGNPTKFQRILGNSTKSQKILEIVENSRQSQNF